MGKPLDECSREELVEIIKCQKETIARTKKFGLVWEDKPEDIVTDCNLELPVLIEDAGKIIEKSDNNAPTNIIIEGDNYHALSVLNYTHAGKIDVIYIDPPYNTGAKDWKYNNDYVDSEDFYRHSKWLSMMKNRLQIAKRLLNPDDSVLICTIDEKEFLHLGCMLEELFPEGNIQMVSSVINRAGTGRKKEFSRTDEYLFFVRFGKASIAMEKLEGEKTPVVWDTLRRSGPSNTRDNTKKQFYPVFVNNNTKRIDSVGQPIPLDMDINEVAPPEGCTAVFPIRDNGTEMMWGCVREEFLKRLKNGYIRVGNYTPNKPQKYVISYLTSGIINDIQNNRAFVESYNEDGSVNAFYHGNKEIPPTTNWNKPLHDAQWYGSNLIKQILGPNRFPYPKSLYAVKDCLYYVTRNKKNAIILDYFAGSGTTMHAVNLLNKEDGGKRMCIMSTNNEVSEKEAKALKSKGIKPGDAEWEKYGIAQYVTYPRTKCTIEGCDIHGKPLSGTYEVSNIPLSEGFKSNVRYFKTAFVSKSGTLDKLRRELSPACEDMIRIREGAYEKIIDDDMLKVFKNARGLTAIIYDRFELEEHIKKIEELETDAPVHLYVFSYSKSDRKDEMPTNLKHDYEAQPIPEGVLEIYKKIFANAKGGRNA